MKKQLFAAMILTAFSARGSARDYILETKRLDNAHVAITCVNGGDPTGMKAGNVLIITCVDERR